MWQNEDKITKIHTDFIICEIDQLKVKNFDFDIEEDEFIELKIFANLLNKNNSKANEKYKRTETFFNNEKKDRFLLQQMEHKFAAFRFNCFSKLSYQLILSLIPLEVTELNNCYTELSIKMEGILNYIDRKTYE